MTTVHGHNQIFQQSGLAQELNHQIHSPKPDPSQAAVQQQDQQVVENTTVQGSEDTVALKQEKEKEKKKKERQLRKAKARNPENDLPSDPDAPGRLLDTTA